MAQNDRITVAYGDGIGPEIMTATLAILDAAAAKLNYETIEVGKAVYEAGFSSGITPEAWTTLTSNRAFLKAPITTPQGGGYKSLNVTMRKTLGLFANVRHCRSHSPFIPTKHPLMDLVIIRENEEDLYTGIEHRQTEEVVQCLKLISRPACERIVRYAFEFATAQGRHKVTCFSKDNIMKMTDGLFHRVFDEIAQEYPKLQSDHFIIDIGAARLADTPERFDVIVMANLYGDILSDVAAQIAGSVGLAASINLGESFAMFEAIHGSAPDIAGQGIANPSGLLMSALHMLVYLGKSQVAAKVHNAWLKTIEDGIHTRDIAHDRYTHQVVNTDEFAKAVIDRLGSRPENLKPSSFEAAKDMGVSTYKPNPALKRSIKELVGVDVFVDFRGEVDELAILLQKAGVDHLPLQMITSRGLKVWPNVKTFTYPSDHWRCRFLDAPGKSKVPQHSIVKLLAVLIEQGVDVIKTENLYNFDGQAGFTGEG